MQLNKYLNRVMDFEETLDLSEYSSNIKDILKLDPVEVRGTMNIVDERYVFNMTIESAMYMECAITAEEVRVPIEEEIIEVFSEEEEDNEIDGITIDLAHIIWLNILALKPMRVVKLGVESTFQSADEVEEEQKEAINPAFKDLKKYL